MEKITLCLIAFKFLLVCGLQEPNQNVLFDTCPVENKFCQLHQDNLIDSISAIDIDECRQLCIDLNECKFLSYFGSNNYPIYDYCMLFSSCEVLEDCNDCFSENKQCYGPCGSKVESKLGDNVIEFITDMELEDDCKKLCLDNANCLYYTHYGKENDHYPDLCVLLSDIKAPLEECSHCVTSVPDCKNYPPSACKFTVNDEDMLYDSYLFNSTETIVKFPLAANLECEATFLAIGDGGNGYTGGGGSGYVKSDLINIYSTEYQVKRRDCPNEDTTCVLDKEGNVVLNANKGGNGGNNYGGNGYSGGGYNSGKGGSNGSDGEGNYAGKGSGLDISDILLETFVLSPGDGGEPNGASGGGGGGVFVNGFGPDSSEYQGKGYGGGGSGVYSSQSGLPGVVLLEVRPK